MKKTKVYTDRIILSDAATRNLVLNEIEAFFKALEKKYKVDIKYNVDKIIKK